MENAAQVPSSEDQQIEFFVPQNNNLLLFKDYACRAIPVAAAVVALCFLIPLLPTPAIAVSWALLSVVPALGLAFRRVMKKTKNQVEFAGGGIAQKFNNGRFLCLLFSYFVGAFCVAGLIVSSPSWGLREWGIVVAGVPLYFCAFKALKSIVKTEFSRRFFKSRLIFIASAATGIIMCIAYAILCIAVPPESYSNAYEAFKYAVKPFENSGSIIMVEVGKLIALSDSMTNLFLSQAFQQSSALAVVIKAISVGSAFFGVAGILGTCSMDKSDIRTVFAQIAPIEESNETSPIMKCAVAIIVVLPIALAGAFIGANSYLDSQISPEEETSVDRFVSSCIGVVVYSVDGVPYDKYKLDDILDEAREESSSISQAAKDELEPLINKACDARLANVDNYLEWYFSLPADYEVLLAQLTNGGEDFLVSKLEEGIDDSQLQEKIQQYENQAAEFNDKVKNQIEEAKLIDVPEEYQIVVETISLDRLLENIEPTEKIVSAGERIAASAATGIGTGIITKHLVSKLLDKTIFKKIATKIASQFSTKAAGAAAGAAIGSLVPGAGTVVGFAAGLAIGTGVDFALVEVDRALNYDSYKAEITSSIEDDRAELLALVE